MSVSREAAALARREATPAPLDRPSQRRSAEDVDAPRYAPVSLVGAEVRTKGGGGDPHVVGMASITERGYEMYDFFGPYTETIAADAFDRTLAANPLVEFTLNHNKGGGAPMASTRNGTLSLSAVKGVSDPGLAYDAQVDGTRTDVADMVKALTRGDLAEASFKFTIVRGQWSPDFTEYRIEEVNLHGGDVTAANFGANPHATSALRAASAPKTGREIVHEDDLRPARSL